MKKLLIALSITISSAQAMQEARKQVYKHFLEHAADISAQEFSKGAKVCLPDEKEVVRLYQVFFSQEAPVVDGKSVQGDTWLHVFARAGNREVATILGKGFDCWQLENEHGETPAALLLGKDEEVPASSEEPDLYTTASGWRPRNIVRIIDNAQTVTLEKIINIAESWGIDEFVSMKFTDEGQLVEGTGEGVYTMLQIFTMRKRTDIVAYLVEHGAKTDLPLTGGSPKKFAEQTGDEKLIAALQATVIDTAEVTNNPLLKKVLTYIKDGDEETYEELLTIQREYPDEHAYSISNLFSIPVKISSYTTSTFEACWLSLITKPDVKEKALQIGNLFGPFSADLAQQKRLLKTAIYSSLRDGEDYCWGFRKRGILITDETFIKEWESLVPSDNEKKAALWHDIKRQFIKTAEMPYSERKDISAVSLEECNIEEVLEANLSDNEYIRELQAYLRGEECSKKKVADLMYDSFTFSDDPLLGSSVKLKGSPCFGHLLLWILMNDAPEYRERALNIVENSLSYEDNYELQQQLMKAVIRLDLRNNTVYYRGFARKIDDDVFMQECEAYVAGQADPLLQNHWDKISKHFVNHDPEGLLSEKGDGKSSIKPARPSWGRNLFYAAAAASISYAAWYYYNNMVSSKTKATGVIAK